MNIFSFFSKPRHWFSAEQNQQIVEAIRVAEKRTSGEVRLFVESKCSYVNALDRAAEIFFGLKMNQTKDRNAVLIYIAMKDRQLAVFADKGIQEKAGTEFWNSEVKQMLSSFRKENYTEAIVKMIEQVGDALVTHFPYEKEDKNELPDEIVFGR